MTWGMAVTCGLEPELPAFQELEEKTHACSVEEDVAALPGDFLFFPFSFLFYFLMKMCQFCMGVVTNYYKLSVLKRQPFTDLAVLQFGSLGQSIWVLG